MNLCEVCLSVFSGARPAAAENWKGSKPRSFSYPHLNYLWGGSHHIQQGSFLRSVRSGCYICSTIFRDCNEGQRRLAHYFQIFYQIYHLSHQADLGEEFRYGLRFGIEVEQTDQGAWGDFYYDCQGDFKILPYKDLVPWVNEEQVPSKTSDAKCLELVRSWLKECDNSHLVCQSLASSQQSYPLRLLDLGSSPDVACRLRRTNPECLEERYCTLSHCWGQANFVRLTRANLTSLERSISISVLSKTFQDAISITRSFGIRYLWIDALCIIQDSLEDWEHEAARMSDIYARSYCNIAALDAVNGEGCFTERPVSLVSPCRVPNYGWSDCTTDAFAIVYEDFWSNNLLRAPVHQRGWVLQERLLSARTVHFGHEQIFWECHNHMACETYQHGIHFELLNSRALSWRLFDSLPEIHHQRASSFKDSRQNTHDLPYKIWSKTVERYMECRLTRSTDKLVAIAGIAQKIAEVTKERYLAGLWMNEDLPVQLLWHVLTRRQADDNPSIRSPIYRAPSWSWACIDGIIVWGWPTKRGKLLVTVIQASTEALARETCEITAASLTVEGYMFEARLEIGRKRPDGTLDEDGTYNLLVEYEEFNDDGSTVPIFYSIVGAVIHLDTSLSPLPYVEVRCLPICMDWAGKSGTGTLRIAGLVLIPNKTALGEFTRIGIFGLDEAEACHFCGLDPSDSDSLEKVFDEIKREAIVIV